VSSETVKVQVEAALVVVDGDCQYVLFSVTVLPHLVILSLNGSVNLLFKEIDKEIGQSTY
jgi:hypothetical protein